MGLLGSKPLHGSHLSQRKPQDFLGLRGFPFTSVALPPPPSPSLCLLQPHPIFHIPWSVDWLLPWKLWILFPICLLVKPPQQLQICSHLTFQLTPILTTPQNCNLFPWTPWLPSHHVTYFSISFWKSMPYNLLIYYSYCISPFPNPPPKM